MRMNRLRVSAHAKKSAIALVLSGLFVSPAYASPQTLETVTIEGEGERPESSSKSLSVLDRRELDQSIGATLADRTDGLPGVAQSGFTPGASRPVIRGQDSDRVKILRNSSASIDASALSPDHALPFDPLSIEQVEIIRGPAALAYGGNAVGGVVNLVDQRIARDSTADFQGEVSFELLGPASTRASGAWLRLPEVNGFNFRLDAFGRKESDRRAPTFTDPLGRTSSRVANSFVDSSGVGAGLSWVHDAGYLGLSVENFETLYGVPQTEEDEVVQIDLKQDRYAFEGEQAVGGWLEKLRFRVANTDYAHQELEGGEPATRFLSDGLTGRLELFTDVGQFGLQSENSEFEAIGEEAFVPGTQTDLLGLFYLGAQNLGDFRLDYGLRFDEVKVQADSTGLSPQQGPVAAGQGFGGPAAERTFSLPSVSASLAWQANESWTLSASLSQTERAPSSFELFADGVHIATSAYEKGNPDLTEEQSRHLDLKAAWKNGDHAFALTAFTARFDNYIGLFQRQGPDAEADLEGELFPVFQFEQVPARFSGFEVEASTRSDWAGWSVQPAAVFDWLRATRTDTGERLPRQTPMRLKLETPFSRSGWTVTPELEYVGQSKPGAGETRTDDYVLVNLGVRKDLALGNTGGYAFAQVRNLTDELAFSATTIETVRYFVPLSGRSLTVGMRLAF